ncbi:MAG: porin [Gemmatimonadales bacterium]
MSRARSIALASLLTALAATPALSQQFEAFGNAARVSIGGRFNPQFAWSSVGAAENDFFIRRARLTFNLTVNDFIDARIEPDFAGTTSLRDAWVRFNFSDAFTLAAGQFKRGFDIFTLSSSVDLSLIERDGRVEGLSTCSGVGSVCSFGRFMESLQYADRDMGLRVEGASERVSYIVTLTNGTGLNSADENDTKSAAGRLTVALTDDVRLTSQLSLHDYVDADGDATAIAFGGDVEVGTWRDGMHLQAGLVTGDNWMILDPSLDPASFLAMQGVVTYYMPMDGTRLIGVEPLARVSWADPDTDSDDDAGIVFTPGLMFYLVGRTKIGANLDIYSPQTGSQETSLKIQTFLYY